MTSPSPPFILLAVEVDGPPRKWVSKLLSKRPALTEAVSKCNRAAMAGQLRALVPRRAAVSSLPTKREWRVSPPGFGTHEPVRGASLQEKQGRAKRRNEMQRIKKSLLHRIIYKLLTDARRRSHAEGSPAHAGNTKLIMKSHNTMRSQP